MNPRNQAITDRDLIIALLKQLIATSSRAGIDPYEPILQVVREWGKAQRVPFQELKDADGNTVALLCSILKSQSKTPSSSTSHPTFLLNATLDTASFGDESKWSASPTAPLIHNGWIYGRGSADSKAAVAMFCHLIGEFMPLRHEMQGNLHFLFDVDEHTGAFGGIKQYVEQMHHNSLSGVFLGYPGNDRIVVGGRGFIRAVVTVNGRAAHSGGSTNRGINAVQRASQLIDQISSLALPRYTQEDFNLPPQITVTAIHGGEGFSNIPDVCTINVDCRLTPLFGITAAKSLIQKAVQKFDTTFSDQPQTEVHWLEGWPAYRTSDDHLMVQTLQNEAERYFKRPVPTAVVGPSNIGNLLASLDIPCIGGFGVTYRSIHATDECLELASIDPVYQTYRATLLRLLHIGDV